MAAGSLTMTSLTLGEVDSRTLDEETLGEAWERLGSPGLSFIGLRTSFGILTIIGGEPRG